MRLSANKVDWQMGICYMGTDSFYQKEYFFAPNRQLVWSEVSTVVEVLTQRSRCEGTDSSHYANAAPVPVRPHN